MAATGIPEHFKNKKFKFSFDKDEVVMVEEHYTNGRLCIQLIAVDAAGQLIEPFATLTTNLVDADPGKNAFFVKVYSENAPMIPELLRSGVFIDVNHPHDVAWKFAKGRTVKFEKEEVLEDLIIQGRHGFPQMSAKNVPLGEEAWTLDGKELGRRLQDAPICPYCGAASEHIGGAVIYPNRPELAEKRFWRCAPCDAYVGCHANTPEPLGRLANAELRKAKMDAHVAFDKLWKGDQSQMKRTDAYQWLANELGIGIEECHIGMFDLDLCRKVIEVATKRLTP